MKRQKRVVAAKRLIDSSHKDLGVEPRWFVIQVHMRETAEFNLKKQSFESFFPRIELKRGKKVVTEPMFKGYGFVLFNPVTDAWGSINGTKGVVGLLPRFTLYPTPRPKGFVEELIKEDPIPEDRFIQVFDEYFPGITEVVVTNPDHLLIGRKGLVLDVRSKLLQVSFTPDGSGQSVWLDKEEVSPTEKVSVK